MPKRSKCGFAEQFGLAYLPFHVIRDQGLLKKQGAARGLEISTEWARLGGGAAANDALLSGSVDIVSAGVGPLLTIWDRTKGTDLEVRGILAGASVPFFLLSSNPKVKTLANFTEADKIALPSVGVSVQARTLQIAAAKEFGDAHYDKLDALTVSLPHPDATQALLSGAGTITAHFSNVPFQYQALQDKRVHKVLDSFEVLGGPATSNIVYTTSKWRKANPEAYAAFIAAYDEAAAWIAANPEGAVDTYIRVTKSKLDPAFLLNIVKNPQITYSTVPLKTEVYAEFLHRVGALKNKAASWQDYFFPEIYERPGS